MKKIYTIVRNPTAIGGVETFARLLKQSFPDISILAFKGSKKPLYKVQYSVIPRSLLWMIVRALSFGKTPKAKLFKFPKIRDQIIILNSPYHLELVPLNLLKFNHISMFLHSSPNCIDDDGSYFGSNRAKRLELMKHVDSIVCLSDTYIEPISNMLSFSDKRIFPVTHTVELPPVAVPKKLNKTIITICRIENKSKRLDHFIEVAKSLSDYTFYIYGFGKDEQLVQEWASNVPNVIMKGATKDIRLAHKDAGIFLLTSDYEGFGITNIEALSQATPVIIAQNSFVNARKIIKDGENGFVCEKFSVEEVIEKIRIIENCYEKFSIGALNSFSSFDETSFKNQWSDIFKRVES